MHIVEDSMRNDATVWGQLPSGPLRGVSVSLWKTPRGSALHGARSCRSLDRSSPTQVTVDLGAADVLGELSWPTRLHCAQELPGELGAYLEFTRSAARDIETARSAAAAASTATERQIGEDTAGHRPWQLVAPFLLARLLQHDEPGPDRYGSSESRSVDAWTAVRDELGAATARARDAAVELHRLLAVDTYETHRVRADNLGSVGVAVAARAVLDHYDARLPGPLWIGYRDAGAAAATAVVVALRPDAQNHRGGLARSLRWEGPDRLVQRYPEAIDNDVLDPLDDAMYSHGMQSWTYHRAHERVWAPERTWKAALSGWVDGETVGFPPEIHERLRLTRPPIFEVIYPALAAAEAAWVAFLRGVAAASRRDRVVTASVTALVGRSTPWQAASAVLMSPFEVYDRDGERRIVTALTELEMTAVHARGQAQVTAAVAPRPMDWRDIGALRDLLSHEGVSRPGRPDAEALAEAVADLPQR